MVPGTRALAFAALWFDPSMVSNVFEPLVADWQRELQDTAGFERFGVRIRGGSALFLSMIAASPNVLLAPWPTSTLRRIMVRASIWTAIFTALNVLPFLVNLRGKVDIEVFAYLSVLLLPQAVAVAFPIAIATIVDVIRSAPRPTREERLAAARVAIAGCLLMLILSGWVYPAANQQFRVAWYRAVTGATGSEPVPGLNEMTIAELTRDGAFRRESWTSGRAEAVARNLSSRLALIILPLVLMWMRWRALLLPRGRWRSAFPLVISAPVTLGVFYSLLAQSRRLADVVFAPRWLGPCLALALLMLGALVIDKLRQEKGPGIFTDR